jgi:hypothetical protein
MDHAKILEALATAIREKEVKSFPWVAFAYNKSFTQDDIVKLSNMTFTEFWDDYLRMGSKTASWEDSENC